LSRINRQAVKRPVPVSPELWHILTDCRYYRTLTSGLFDITLKDFANVQFEEGKHTVFLPSEDFYFDLGGYAKGYAMGKIKQILAENGIVNAFIDFGNSSIAALGHHPYGDCWIVSVGNPYKKGEVLGEFKLRDNDLSTSGNTPAYTGHIVNPHTGQFTDEKKLVCVVTPNSVEAEVLSTTLMLATAEQKEQILSKFKVDSVTIYNL
jgi:Membrane-associated lipoprotein involved in thiamine biosynthesis